MSSYQNFSWQIKPSKPTFVHCHTMSNTTLKEKSIRYAVSRQYFVLDDFLVSSLFAQADK